jgi:hypothetical protein
MLRVAVLASSKGTPAEFLGNDLRFGVRYFDVSQNRRFNPTLLTRLLLYPQNRVFCRLGDSEFDDGHGWNLDFLLRLRINADARLPLLLHQLAETGQDEFAVLFHRFVGDVAECIEEYSSGSFVGLGGSSECNLQFTFGHVWSLFMAAELEYFKIYCSS